MSLSIFVLVAAVSFVLGGTVGVLIDSSARKGKGKGNDGEGGREWLLCVAVGSVICVSILGMGWELFYLKTVPTPLAIE